MTPPNKPTPPPAAARTTAGDHEPDGELAEPPVGFGELLSVVDPELDCALSGGGEVLESGAVGAGLGGGVVRDEDCAPAPPPLLPPPVALVIATATLIVWVKVLLDSSLSVIKLPSSAVAVNECAPLTAVQVEEPAGPPLAVITTEAPAASAEV